MALYSISAMLCRVVQLHGSLRVIHVGGGGGRKIKVICSCFPWGVWKKEREQRREGGREGGRERVGGKEGRKEGGGRERGGEGREGGREGRRERKRGGQRRREGGRGRENFTSTVSTPIYMHCTDVHTYEGFVTSNPILATCTCIILWIFTSAVKLTMRE